MRKKCGWIFGAVVVALIAIPFAASAATTNISILYTADTHGRLRSYYYDSTKPIGGVAKRAIFFQDKRRHKSMIWLTLDSGDALSGTALADVFQGYLAIQAMNRLGYDAMALGVHDFDYGTEVLRQRIAEAEFPVLSANVKQLDTGQPFTTPYVIIERQGTRIALFGLTAGDVARRVAPANFSGLTADDPVETARVLVPQLEGQADVIVAITHMGINDDIRLASEVRGIDVIVGGMSHSELQVPMKFEDTLIVHSAEYGRNVGMLKLSFNAGQAYQQVYFSNELVPIAGKWVPNSDYVAWLDTYDEQLAQRMDVIVGSSALEMGSLKMQSAETPLGNYVTDVLREQTAADVALLPAGFFDAGLPAGPITQGDLYSCLPYDQYAVVVDVTGGELQEILNDAADQIGKPGFPQISGASFGILAGRAYAVRVGGQEVDPFSTYRLATTDVLSEGVLGYASLGKIESRSHTGRLVRDMVRQRLASGQVAQSSSYQRIQFHAYDSSIMAGTTPGEPAITPPVSAPADTPTSPIPPAGSEAPAGAETAPISPVSEAPGTHTPGETAGSSPDTAGETGGTELADLPVAPAAVDTEEPATAGDEDMGSRLDRTGEPLDEPVRVEDETVTDSGSELTPEVQPPAETTGTEEPFFEDVEMPVVDMGEPDSGDTILPTPAVGVPLGSSRGTDGGLQYYFTLAPLAAAYEFVLEISNPTMQPVTLSYATGAKFDFIAKSGTDVLWYYNWNRFFMQTTETQTLAPGEVITFRGEWDGLTNDDLPLPPGVLRFEAVHQLTGNAARLEFDAMVGQ